MPLVSIKVAKGTIGQHIGTIPGRLGSGRLTCDYKAISVQLQLQLPTGTELGKKKPPTEVLVTYGVLSRPNKKLGRVLSDMKKKLRGGV